MNFVLLLLDRIINGSNILFGGCDPVVKTIDHGLWIIDPGVKSRNLLDIVHDATFEACNPGTKSSNILLLVLKFTVKSFDIILSLG